MNASFVNLLQDPLIPSPVTGGEGVAGPVDRCSPGDDGAATGTVMPAEIEVFAKDIEEGDVLDGCPVVAIANAWTGARSVTTLRGGYSGRYIFDLEHRVRVRRG